MQTPLLLDLDQMANKGRRWKAQSEIINVRTVTRRNSALPRTVNYFIMHDERIMYETLPWISLTHMWRSSRKIGESTLHWHVQELFGTSRLELEELRE